MLKKTKLISLILLSGAFVVPAGASAETAPFKQETNISQQNGKVTCIVEDSFGPVIGASVAAEGALALTLLPDGGFAAEAGGAQAAGTYTAANGVLTLLPDGRDAYAVRYRLDGASLLLMQDGQEALPLIREEETP